MINWSPEFQGLDQTTKDLLLRQSTRRTFSNNGIIYVQEDDADRFYFVESGYVRLSYLMEDGTAILYAIVPPGQSFGELGVFDQSYYPDTASSIGEATVVGVRSDLFHDDHHQKSVLMDALGKLIAKRYRTYIDVTKSLYLSTLTARLAQSLLRLIDSLGETMNYEGRQVSFLGSSVTQSDLGAMARGTRGNVNRALKSWEREGWIVVKNRRIIVLRRRELEMLTIDEGF
ncbi:MAG: Crp/Fnr family transcriptional regulator [Pseudomonadota bacterium]